MFLLAAAHRAAVSFYLMCHKLENLDFEDYYLDLIVFHNFLWAHLIQSVLYENCWMRFHNTSEYGQNSIILNE